jgi:hypothetical protein
METSTSAQGSNISRDLDRIGGAPKSTDVFEILGFLGMWNIFLAAIVGGGCPFVRGADIYNNSHIYFIFLLKSNERN